MADGTNAKLGQVRIGRGDSRFPQRLRTMYTPDSNRWIGGRLGEACLHTRKSERNLASSRRVGRDFEVSRPGTPSGSSKNKTLQAWHCTALGPNVLSERVFSSGLNLPKKVMSRGQEHRGKEHLHTVIYPQVERPTATRTVAFEAKTARPARGGAETPPEPGEVAGTFGRESASRRCPNLTPRSLQLHSVTHAEGLQFSMAAHESEYFPRRRAVTWMY